MLDIKFIRENKKIVERAIKNKNTKVNLVQILRLDKEKRNLQQRIEFLRQERNKLAKDKKNISKGKKVKKMLKDLEPQLAETSEALLELIYHLPNIPARGVPVGKNESQNQVVKKWGKTKKFSFKAKSHLELGEKLDLIDIKRGAKVSGSRFYYLKNEAVYLEFAIVHWLLNMLSEQKFSPIIPPVLEKLETAKGTGYFEALSDDAYHTSQDEMILVGTSEQSIIPYYGNEIIDHNELPIRFLSFSTCFRREAGSYGKDVHGIFRAHQFDKLEMVSFCRSDQSEKEHKFLLSLEEKIMKALKIPYQVVQMCSGDLGLPAAAKYDIEAWIPSQQCYRETHSTSNCTDFQARRLNIRYRNKEGKTELVHTLNGTALAIGRILIAILENYQQADGSIKVPSVLQPYVGFKRID